MHGDNEKLRLETDLRIIENLYSCHRSFSRFVDEFRLYRSNTFSSNAWHLIISDLESLSQFYSKVKRNNLSILNLFWCFLVSDMAEVGLICFNPMPMQNRSKWNPNTPIPRGQKLGNITFDRSLILKSKHSTSLSLLENRWVTSDLFDFKPCIWIGPAPYDSCLLF